MRRASEQAGAVPAAGREGGESDPPSHACQSDPRREAASDGGGFTTPRLQASRNVPSGGSSSRRANSSGFDLNNFSSDDVTWLQLPLSVAVWARPTSASGQSASLASSSRNRSSAALG